MSFRGRGRGRGGFGRGGFGFAKQEPFVPFPDVELPERNGVREDRTLVNLNMQLQNFWTHCAYHIEDTDDIASQDIDIERYSDREKLQKRFKRDSFLEFMKISSFPTELQDVLGGTKGQARVGRARKKVRWNPEAGQQKLDLLEQHEQKHGGDEEEKKEDENENEEEEEEVDEEYSDDGDYNKNRDFDDDEDDYNLDDDYDDEPIL